MIRSIAVAVAFALSVTACTSETTEENEPTQEQNEKSESTDTPVVDETGLTPKISGPCLPQKFPVCGNGFSCYCSSSGYRVCVCN